MRKIAGNVAIRARELIWLRSNGAVERTESSNPLQLKGKWLPGQDSNLQHFG